MAPLPKLVWFPEQEPKLHERVAHWVGIKDYVLLRLADALVTDHSVASATGLMDIHRSPGTPEALRLAGIAEEQLPELVATTTVLPGLTAEAPARPACPPTPRSWSARATARWRTSVSARYAPASSACSIGTSGAMRVIVERPAVDPLGGVFCYALTEDRWVVGGAINNGGIVLQWAGDALAPEFGDAREEELLALGRAGPRSAPAG